MSAIDDKIHRGLERQLTTWRAQVDGRGQRLGWKVGFNMRADQQRLGLPSAMIGYLSREHRLADGQHYTPPPGGNILVEPEIAVYIGVDLSADASEHDARAAIHGYTAALELVDTTRSVNDDIEEILAGNLFHDSVLIAEPMFAAEHFTRDQLHFSLHINDNEVCTLDPVRVPQDFAPLILTVARLLATYGECLKKGDWIITGAAAKPVGVNPGYNVTLVMGTLGQLSVQIR